MCTKCLFLVSYEWKSVLVNILQKCLDNRAFMHRHIKHNLVYAIAIISPAGAVAKYCDE